MPKVKTKRTIAKRMKLTANGKLKHMHPNKDHILTKKSRNRKRRLRKAGYISEGPIAKTIRQLIA